MLAKTELLQNLNKVEQFAKASRRQRFFKQPFKYTYALTFRNLIYPLTNKSKAVKGTTFFNLNMHLQLPAGTEIYLSKGKAHPAETKLAKLLIHQLQTGDTFVDVGAHYGYFSLLACQLVGKKGKVFAFEASPQTFNCLQKNNIQQPQLQVLNQAISNTNEALVFYQFSNLYSEYNSFNIQQYKKAAWFAKNKPQQLKISATTLNQFLTEQGIKPSIIKIDVEGAELKVIQGALPYLKNHQPLIVMEYLSTKRGNTPYQKAEALLRSIQYQPYLISKEGALILLKNVTTYLDAQGAETENIVFKKR